MARATSGRSLVASWSWSAFVAVATTTVRPDWLAGARDASDLPVPVPAWMTRGGPVRVQRGRGAGAEGGGAAGRVTPPSLSSATASTVLRTADGQAGASAAHRGG